MRKAISMIELIISIVIIGIVVTAMPMVLTQTSNSNAFALQQEAIFHAKTKIGVITKAAWDSNAIPTNMNDPLFIVNTNGTSADNAFNTQNNNRRLGSVYKNDRRTIDANRTPPVTGSLVRLPTNDGAGTWGAQASNNWNDVDDYDESDELIETPADSGDFVTKINLRTNVRYVSDRATYSDTNITNFDFLVESNGTSNIKLIEVNATDQNTNESVVILRAYSSNIGESGLLRRTW